MSSIPKLLLRIVLVVGGVLPSFAGIELGVLGDCCCKSSSSSVSGGGGRGGAVSRGSGGLGGA